MIAAKHRHSNLPETGESYHFTQLYESARSSTESK